MNWKPYKYYASSDKGYHVAKHGHPPLVMKYLAYGPDSKLLDCPAFYCFSDAAKACEEHYADKFKQTDEDMF